MASTSVAPDEICDRLWKRYREAYSVAAGVISFGKLVQMIAAVATVLILFVSFVLGIGAQSWWLFGIGAVAAVIVGAGGWISGMITMAQGQIIQSVIDTAVNTSPHLDDLSKAQFLGVG